MDAARIEAARRALLNGSAERTSGRWQTFCSTPIGDARTCAYSADTFRADVALHALLHGLDLAPPLTRVLTHSSYPAGIQYSLVAHADVRLTDALHYIKELEDSRANDVKTARSGSPLSDPKYATSSQRILNELSEVLSKSRHLRFVLADGAASLIVALAVSGVVTAIKPENVVLVGRRMLVTELDSEWTSMVSPPTKIVPLELRAKRRAAQAAANEALPRGDIGILGERPNFMSFCESASSPAASYRLPFVIYAAHQMARSLASSTDDIIFARLLPARVARMLGAERKPMHVAGDGSLPLRVPIAEALREMPPAPPLKAAAMDPKRLEPFLSVARLRRLCLVYKRLQHLRLPFRGCKRERPSPERCERAVRMLNSFDPEADAVPRAFEFARNLSAPTADPREEDAQERAKAYKFFTQSNEGRPLKLDSMAKYDAEFQREMDKSWSLEPNSKVPLTVQSVFDLNYEPKAKASSRVDAKPPVVVQARPMRGRHQRRVDRKLRELDEVAEDEPASEDLERASEADDDKEIKQRENDAAEEQREREEEREDASEGSDKEAGTTKKDEEIEQREAGSAEEPKLFRVKPPDLSDPEKKRLFILRARASAASAQRSASVQNAKWERKYAKRVGRWYAELGREREKAFPRLKRLRYSEVPALYAGEIGVPAASLADTLGRPVHGTSDAVADVERRLISGDMVKAYSIDDAEDDTWRTAVGGAARDGVADGGAILDADRADLVAAADYS
jgi:hypothetical protein